MLNKLSNEEKIKCLKLYQSTGDNEALSILMLSNQGLVRKIASKYKGQSIEFDDLCQIGNIGLVRALQLYDYEKYSMGAFSTYVGRAIENKIQRELNINNKHSEVLSFDDPVFRNKDDDELTLEKYIGTEKEEVYDEVISSIQSDVIKTALSCLTSREQQIIVLRYGLEDDNVRTLDEIAELLEVSRERIRQIEEVAIRKLRHPRNTRKLKDFIK